MWNIRENLSMNLIRTLSFVLSKPFRYNVESYTICPDLSVSKDKYTSVLHIVRWIFCIRVLYHSSRWSFLCFAVLEKKCFVIEVSEVTVKYLNSVWFVASLDRVFLMASKKVCPTVAFLCWKISKEYSLKRVKTLVMTGRVIWSRKHFRTTKILSDAVRLHAFSFVHLSPFGSFFKYSSSAKQRWRPSMMLIFSLFLVWDDVRYWYSI